MRIPTVGNPPDVRPLHKECPECHEQMFKYVLQETMTSYPPGFTWRWGCICGHNEKGDIWFEDGNELEILRRWGAIPPAKETETTNIEAPKDDTLISDKS